MRSGSAPLLAGAALWLVRQRFWVAQRFSAAIFPSSLSALAAGELRLAYLSSFAIVASWREPKAYADLSLPRANLRGWAATRRCCPGRARQRTW